MAPNELGAKALSDKLSPVQPTPKWGHRRQLQFVICRLFSGLTDIRGRENLRNEPTLHYTDRQLIVFLCAPVRIERRRRVVSLAFWEILLLGP